MPVSVAASANAAEPRRPVSSRQSDWSRRRSSPVFSAGTTTFESLNSVASSVERSAISPPPASVRSSGRKQENLLTRLRSNSGLSFHTNNSALRQYTDYNQDGSTKLSQFDPVEWRESAVVGDGHRESRRVRDEGSSPTPSVPDFFSREMVMMVLHNPTVSHRLWQFAQAKGGGENMEFLMKIQDYSRSVNLLVSSMASISTTFTSIGSTRPLNLPPQLSRSLNADVKHISTSVLPGLEILFSEARGFVEQRIMREIYPEFVKHQLSLCMKTSLSGNRATATAFNFAYPGLGDAFCLTDPYKADNPIVYASDGFVDATGYTRAEVIPRNGRFLQGPLTDGGAVRRIKEALSRKVEVVELVLNYRKDGQPFWNLLFVCPLKATNGKVRFYLGGQINVSETISSQRDVLRVLNFGSATPETVAPDSKAASGPDQGVAGQTRPEIKVVKLERGASIRSRNRSNGAKSDRPPSAGRGLFKPFRKSHDTSSALLSPPPSRHNATSNTSMTGLEQLLTSRSVAQHLSLPAQIEDFHTAYSRFIMLQFVPSSSDTPRGAAAAAARLKVTFCAQAALDAIGLGPGAQEAVLYHDIFTVLSELAGSPSVTALFRTAVRERVSVGDAVSLEMLVPAAGGVGLGYNAPAPPSNVGRRGSIMSFVGRGGDEGGRGRRRNSGTFSGSGALEKGAANTPGMRRLMSHWTPLKDRGGTVCWVVLVVMPTFML